MNDLKEEFNIFQIEQFVPLQKSGTRYKCCCPIHGEKTPSLVLYPETNTWYCFGCNQGGDYIDFIKLKDNLGSRDEAYEQITGRKSKFHSSEEELKPNERLIAFFHKFYQAILNHDTSAKGALEYLAKRGFDSDDIERYELGFSNGVKMKTFLALAKEYNEKNEKKVPQNEFDIVDLGIINKEGTCDLFFNRILFPLYNANSHLTGFTGRTISSNDEIKYLNSKEGLFKKSNCFFNWKNALPEMKKKEEVIICEGTLDAMSYDKSGAKNVLATCGVALTRTHLAILKKYCKKIILAYDNDKAGIQSILKTARICREAGFEVETIILNDDSKDANEYMLKNGQEALKRRAEKTFSIYNYIYRKVSKEHRMKKIYEFLLLEDVTQVNEILKKISKYLDVEISELNKQLTKAIESDSEELLKLILFQLTKTNQKLIIRILSNFLTNKEKKMLEKIPETKDYAYYNAYEIKELCFKFIEARIKEEDELF